MKIINILPHIPQKEIHNYSSPEEYIKRFPLTEYIKLNKEPYWVGFFRLDWHHHCGMYIKKLAPDIEIECWRPYGHIIERAYKKNVDGLLHKVFPSTSVRIKKIGAIEKSPLMLENLKQEMQRKDVIVHFYGSHDLLITWLLLKLKPKGKPIILQHLGWGFSWFGFKYRKTPLKLIPYFFERKALKYVSLYLTASKVEEKFLRQNFPDLRCEFFYNGIDLEEFPLIPKQEARKRLNIPLYNKVILYVGRYYSTKNVGQIIEVYKELKDKDNNVKLFLVGGYKDDEFYQFAVDSGANVVLRQDKPITDFFAAADVYIMPINDPMHQDFGGFGIAPIEALALNTPILSPNIKHFPGTEEEKRIIGSELDGEMNIQKAIEKLLKKNNKKNLRRICQKYYDINENTLKLIKLYNSILTNNSKK